MGTFVRTIKYAFKMSLKSLTKRKFRTTLTVVGIIIGMTTIISLSAIGAGLRTEISGLVNQLLGAGVIIQSRSGGNIPQSVVPQLESVPNVDSAMGLIMQFSSVGGQPNMVWGVEAEKAAATLQITLSEGTQLSENDTEHALVGNGFARSRGLKVGDVITIQTTMLGSGGGKPFIISGVLAPHDPELDSGVFLTLLAAQQLLGYEGQVQMIMVSISNPELTEETVELIESAFPDAEVMQKEDLLNYANQILDVINSVLMALGSISLAVGAIGIMNTTMMSVLERTREIGVLKSIGAKKWHILTIFLMESLIVALLGGIFGCLVSLGTVNLLVVVFGNIIGMNIPYAFDVGMFLTAISIAIILGLGAGAYPAWRGASIKPVEALRYE